MFQVKIKDQKFDVSIDHENKSGSINQIDFKLDKISTGNQKYHIIKDNCSYNIEIIHKDDEEKTVTLMVNGKKHLCKVNDQYDILLQKMGFEVTSAKTKEVKSPMPGLVLNIMAELGSSVKKGDSLFILEAMKMENIIKASSDGIVKRINVTKGQAVEKNQSLLLFE